MDEDVNEIQQAHINGDTSFTSEISSSAYGINRQ